MERVPASFGAKAPSVLDRVEARGVAIGEKRGEARGIAIGEKRGEARGVAIGEKEARASLLF